MIFIYTARSCASDDTDCDDFPPGPTDTATLIIGNPCDSGDILFSGMVTIGDEIILTRFDGSCLPDSMDVTVIDSALGVVQSNTIDTSCDGRGLFLLNSYGALEFQGYSCDQNDVHNCFVDVLYNVTTCNIGDIDMTLNELLFDINGTLTDFLLTLTPEELLLVPAECLTNITQGLVVERCGDREYCASARVNASSEVSGPICEDMDELKFDLIQGSVQPTPSPSSSPSREPSSPPSTRPSESPSQSPTGVCVVDIELDCMTLENVTFDGVTGIISCVDIPDE